MRWNPFRGHSSHPVLYHALLIAAALATSVPGNADPPESICLAVYPPAGHTMDPKPGFSAHASELELRILSAEPFTSPRPILLLVDPNSYSRAEMRRRISALARALSAASEARGRHAKIRVGIPILDGILGGWLADPKTLVHELDKTLESYLPDSLEGEQANPGRTIDLLAALIQKAQDDGEPVDALLVARDRVYRGDEVAYFITSAQRQLLDMCLKKGSTLHGYLSGGGLLQRVCVSSGGLVFQDNQAPESIANRIIEQQERGFLLKIAKPASLPSGTRSALSIRSQSSNGKPLELRAPAELWQHPAGKPVPDQYHVRQALDWFRRAKEAEEDQNYTSAVRFASSSIQEDSWNSQVFYLGGRTAFALGDLPAAASYLAQAIQVGANDEATMVLYGRAFEKMGRAQTALETYRAALKAGMQPSPAIHLQMARLLSAAGMNEEASTLYANLVAAGKGSDTTHAEYGRVLWRLGKQDEAREQFETALAKNPSSTAALLYFSDAAYEQRNFAQAAELAQRAVQSSPKDQEVHAQMAKVQAGAGNWGSASGYYRTAITLAPNRRDLVDALVDALIHEGKESEAREILTRVTENDPSDVLAYRDLAKILAHNGETSEAVSTLEKGAAYATPEAHVLYREAAELRERRGEYGQALLDYRAMFRAAPPEVARSDTNKLSHHLSFLSRLLSSPRSLFGSSNDKKGSAAADRIDPDQVENAISAAAGERSESAGMPVPGGLGLLAQTLGIEPSLLKEPDAIERIFSYVLEVAPSHSERLQDNPIRRDAVGYLRLYDSLINHMRKRGLAPPDFDPVKGHEFRFSLLQAGEEQKKTRQFLSFFGVGFKSRQDKDGNYRLELNLKQNKGAAERQQFLRNLGVNLLDRNLREIRFSLKDEELPILFDSRTWSAKVLGNEKGGSKYLLGLMMLNPRAMRLYVALAGCAVSTRDALMMAMGPGELLNLVDAVAMYGRFLEFRESALQLPGSQKAWETLVGASANDAAKFIPTLIRKDEGRALLLYYALSVAPKSVQRALTANADRLNELYQLLPAYYSARARNGKGAGRYDLGRVLRQLAGDEQGLVVEVDQRFGRYFMGGAGLQGTGKGSGTSGPVRLPPGDLLRFVNQERDSKAGARDPLVETLEFVRYLQSCCPEMLSDSAIDAIMRDPWQSPVLLDLVWDLHLPADLLVKYLTYCNDVLRAGGRGWNVNRTRTSQALLHLLSLLYRQGALPREQAIKLFGSALDRLSSDQEDGFALQVAAFLSDQLIPVLEASLTQPRAGGDSLLLALAGPERMQEFAFDGKQLQFYPAKYKLQRMVGAIQQQRYTPLAVLLRNFKILSELKSAKEVPAAALQDLRKALAEVQSAELKPDSPSVLKEAVASFDAHALSSKIEASQRPSRGRSSSFSQLASEIAAALHGELGVTLLTYCYAYHGAPETDALAFDANFVRKHLFYDPVLSKEGGWVQARLEQKEGIGTFISGSISGLNFELCNLETAQLVQSFGRREGKSLVPTILMGIRSMPRSLRSDRAQEYVALSVRLGREVLALSAVSRAVGGWSENFLSERVPPKRRERAVRLMSEGYASGATDALSPSELFLLGEAYLNSSQTHFDGERADLRSPQLETHAQGSHALSDNQESGPSPTAGNGSPHEMPASSDDTPNLGCPVQRRLREILPPRDSPAAAGFHQEVQQYGSLLRKRLGLNQLSLAIEDSYEQLEISAREEVLFERLCDLKIRLAEIDHALGLPASLGEVIGELAIRDILPRSTAIRTNSWKLVLEQIGRLETDNARNWIEELINRGILTISSKGAAEK